MKKISTLKIGEKNLDLVRSSIEANYTKLIKDYTDSNKLIDRLIKLKDKKPNVREKARYYNATIGTKYEGQSSFLYNEVISFIKNNDINTLSDIFKVEKIQGINVYTIK